MQVFYINNYSTFEKTHNWNQIFLEINIVVLEEILKQWMTASSPIKIYTEPFKEWIIIILLVTKTDTLLQGMDGCD